MPISVSPTQADFLPADMACPMRPETLSSLVVYGGIEITGHYKQSEEKYLDVKGGIEAHL